ncbi:MAG: hypothetical protein FJX76_03660 [Armatimonadetes bacterium]|nr:hypothetical protein [Armatimonadota bacterium]
MIRTRLMALAAALWLIAGGVASAQYIDKYYNPFEYSKDPARFKAPPVPKYYNEDEHTRFYTLVDFKPNDKNVGRLFLNTDEKKNPIALDGEAAKFSVTYLSKGDLENFVEYWLAGRFKTFECVLTVPDNFEGHFWYYVYGDDKKLLQGDDLGKDRKSARISLSVEGVRRLVLKTAGGKQTNKLRVTWVNPILTEPKDDE